MDIMRLLLEVNIDKNKSNTRDARKVALGSVVAGAGVTANAVGNFTADTHRSKAFLSKMRRETRMRNAKKWKKLVAQVEANNKEFPNYKHDLWGQKSHLADSVADAKRAHHKMKVATKLATRNSRVALASGGVGILGGVYGLHNYTKIKNQGK